MTFEKPKRQILKTKYAPTKKVESRHLKRKKKIVMDVELCKVKVSR